MQQASQTFNGHPEYSMSAARAITPYQYPTNTYIQNPGSAMYPSHPQTYNIPGSPASPYQPWGENMPSMFTTYQGAPYSYPYPQHIPTPHHMTHPQVPQYIPYNMTHPQSMPQTHQYSSFSHPMTHLNTMPQAPRYSSPYQYPMTHPQTVTQRPQYMVPPPYRMTVPQTMPNSKVYSPQKKDKKYWTKGKCLVIDSKTSQCSANSCSEASESSSSEDENSEGDNNNKSEEPNNESSNENVSDDASESDSLKDVKIEEKIKEITQETTDTKESTKLKGENYPLKSKCTENKTSKKKKKKKNNKSVKDEGSSISEKAPPVTNASQSTENKKELQKLKGKYLSIVHHLKHSDFCGSLSFQPLNVHFVFR